MVTSHITHLHCNSTMQLAPSDKPELPFKQLPWVPSIAEPDRGLELHLGCLMYLDLSVFTESHLALGWTHQTGQLSQPGSIHGSYTVQWQTSIFFIPLKVGQGKERSVCPDSSGGNEEIHNIQVVCGGFRLKKLQYRSYVSALIVDNI